MSKPMVTHPDATLANHRASMEARREAVRATTARYMRECPASLIDMAMRQGWGRSLEDLARSAIRDFIDANDRAPTMQEMTTFRIPDEPANYYRNHGQSHMPEVAAEIMAARRRGGNITGRMTGEHAE